MSVNLKLIYVLSVLLFSRVEAQPEWENDRFLHDSIYSSKVLSCILSPPASLIDFPVIGLNSRRKTLSTTIQRNEKKKATLGI